MLTSYNSSVCSPCPSGTYSMQGGSIAIRGRSYSVPMFQCFDCPFGGDCASGVNIVRASRDYWGMQVDVGMEDTVGNVTLAKAWRMSRCPLAYCCQNASSCTPGVSVASGGESWMDSSKI